MSLITGLFDSSLLQALSTDSGGGLKKSERANTTRDQPRPGDEVGRGWEGSEGKGASPPRPPFFRNFSCAHHFVPLSTICTPGTGYFDLKLQMVQFREWCIRPITSSFFRLPPNCRTEMPVRFVNACASGASCIYVLFNRDSHSVFAWKLR